MEEARTQPPRSRLRRALRVAAAVLALLLTAEVVRVYGLTNKHTVLPGKVYRTAQLGPDELKDLIRSRGIRTVVNLRGTSPDTPWYQAEARVTHAEGVNQEDVSLSAKRLPAPAEIRRLIEVLDHTEYPIVVHCQRGADRTGLVSAVAMLLHTNADPARARRQLWPRYGHVRAGRTAMIDRFFDFYDDWLRSTGKAHTPDLFRAWAEHVYCPGPYRAKIELAGSTRPEVAAGQGFRLTVRATNQSIEPWEFHTGPSGIQLRYYLYTPAGKKLFTGHAGRVRATVQPGESIELVAGFPPVEKPGRYLVHADLLDTQPIDILDSDFVQYGSEPLIVDVTVR